MNIITYLDGEGKDKIINAVKVDAGRIKDGVIWLNVTFVDGYVKCYACDKFEIS